jgi:anti-sigma regulatory factor (Ser/Thr protein kinase)
MVRAWRTTTTARSRSRTTRARCAVEAARPTMAPSARYVRARVRSTCRCRTAPSRTVGQTRGTFRVRRGERVDPVGEQRWRTRIDARAADVPGLRHAVVELLERECPGIDRAAAALVVTELASNVVCHAYPGAGGPLEVEIHIDTGTPILTVRDWGGGFGQSERRGTGLGLSLVRGISADVWMEHRGCTEVHARLACQPTGRPGAPTA